MYAYLAEMKWGKPASKVALYYVCRSDPEAYKDYRRPRRWRTIEIPYTDRHRASPEDLLTDAVKAATSTRHATRWFADGGKISSLYSPCRSCPWQRRCLGKSLEDGETHVAEEAAADALRGLAETKTIAADASAAMRQFLALQHAKHSATKSVNRSRELIDDLGLD